MSYNFFGLLLLLGAIMHIQPNVIRQVSPAATPLAPTSSLNTTALSTADYTATFTLASAATVSAGVYSADSTLIRTLFSGVRYPAGAHKVQWDGKDDYKKPVLDRSTNYVVRVVSNNIAANWEGVLGNTSAQFTGPSVHRGWDVIKTMTIIGTTAYYGKGYSEGAPSHIKFNLADIQDRIVILPNIKTGQNVLHTTSDGTTIYWGGLDSFGGKWFVFATRKSDDTEIAFTEGKPIKVHAGYTYKHAIEIKAGNKSSISGLAVQNAGDFLFVAHSALNTISVLDKKTGNPVQSVSVTAPGKIAVDAQDNLWVISGNNTVSHYKVNTNGTFGSPDLSLKGCTEPMAIAVSPITGDVLVADGGSKQQIRSYSTSGGLRGVFGQEGGYTVNSTVTNDRFYFSDPSRSINSTFIAFQPNGSFWVGDTGNARAMHFTADNKYIEEIMFLPKTYSCNVDVNNPSRVFAHFLEFEVDYSKPLGGTNGSWKLVRNWGATVPTSYRNQFNLLKGVTTLRNGHTYATLSNSANGAVELVELVSKGPLRLTGVIVSPNAEGGTTQLYPDGSLRRTVRAGVGKSQAFTVRSLSGFDSRHNPQWAKAVTVAATPVASADDPIYYGNTIKLRSGEITSTNLIIAFDGNKASKKYHLGAIRLGDKTWKWRTAVSTNPSYSGPYPTDGAYDIGNGVNTTGIAQQVNGRIILWGYHGEFWKAGQTNMYSLVYDNGLLLKTFGATSFDNARKKLPIPPAGMAGNAFSGSLVKIDDNLYYYHNDENYHSGVHRWKISGLNTVHEQVIPISLSTSSASVTAARAALPESNGKDLLDGLPNNTKLLAETAGWVRDPGIEIKATRDKWLVNTNKKTYAEASPDVQAVFRSNVAGTVRTLERTLGSDAPTKGWELVGTINYEGILFGNNEQGGQYLDVLDRNDKVISRFYFITKDLSKGNTSIMAGNKSMASGPTKTIISLVSQPQPIRIVANADGTITTTYADYAPVKSSLVDKAANYRTPAKLRLYFFTTLDGNSYDRVIDISALRFDTR
ncbi:hypothetical protein [Spirosoma sp. KNUC1025]|uniref:hypothetical protein n=1 Tax=Spirosoma sp. KNUC1025 TaxID=2894082 RepID=UPI00386C02B9|nr:hypothetical protein LN737_22470 [Spirosoma sp. KNUC1025]